MVGAVCHVAISAYCFGVSHDMSKPRYTKEMLGAIVKISTTMAQVCRALGIAPATGSQSYIKQRVVSFGIDTSHFSKSPWNKGQSGRCLKKPEDVLVAGYIRRPRARQTRRAMIAVGIPYVCVRCDNDGNWRGIPLTLEVDHINNDWTDNRQENVQFMCPNCHGQKTGKDHSKEKRQRTVRRPRIALPEMTVPVDLHWRRRPKPDRRKVTRPDEKTLREMVWRTPTSILATQLGVSDVMVGKWCRYYGIPKPPRGYWTRTKTSGAEGETRTPKAVEV